MQATNLHIFNDNLGFFTNKTIEFVNQTESNSINYFLNTAKNCANKNDSVKYKSLSSQLKTNEYKNITKVVFHCFRYFNVNDIKKINEKYKAQNIKFVWMFWSHEYYQLPHNFKNLYKGLSRKFLLRKYISFHIEYFTHFLKGNVNSPFYTGINSFEKHFKKFDLFSSFIKGDYDAVMKNTPNVKYFPLKYLSINDFPKTHFDNKTTSNDIMIGHSGSPILNHYEVVSQLESIQAKNKIILPLSYGKKSYINLLKRKLADKVELEIELFEKYLPKEEYYNKLNEIGIFILNSHCQQALGNIAYLLLIGTKIFLSKHSSTYKTLKKESFHIYSIEDDFSEENLQSLSVPQKQHNFNAISKMLDPNKVADEWINLLEL